MIKNNNLNKQEFFNNNIKLKNNLFQPNNNDKDKKYKMNILIIKI